jgi:signal transduction histidine kinase
MGAANPPPAAARAADILDLLPVPVAVRAGDGYAWRNAAHRALAVETLDGDGGSDAGADLEGLGIARVTDPASGRVYLCSRTPLGDGPDLLEVLEDITGRQSDRDEIARHRDALARDAEALARANRELAVIDRAKAAFIALAAHEVRTPLTALANALALLRRVPETADPASGRRFLAMAERNVGRLAALADDLLAFTQLEVGHLGLRVTPVDVAALLAEASEAAGDAAADAGAGGRRVRVTGGGRLPLVHGDPARLGPVVRGLLVHALDRAPEGLAVRVALSHRRRWPRPADPTDPAEAPSLPGAPEGWVEVAVSDAAGPVGPAAADGDDALGLGLAVGRRIAALHGGALWARRGGSGVVLRLPVLGAAVARLLAVQEAWRRLPRHGAAPALVVLRPEGGGEGDADALRAALGEDPGFASVPEAGEVVGAVAGEAAVARVRRAAAGWSAAKGCPIRMGWSRADAAADFAAALARARAAVRPLDTADGAGGGTERGPDGGAGGGAQGEEG